MIFLDDAAPVKAVDAPNPDDMADAAHRDGTVSAAHPGGMAAPSHPGDALRDLGGVRAGESHADELIDDMLRRDRSRILLTPRHAMAIILVLVTVLCASVTLLTIQGTNLVRGGMVAGLAQSGERDDSSSGGAPSDGSASAGTVAKGGDAAEGESEQIAGANAGPSGAEGDQPESGANASQTSGPDAQTGQSGGQGDSAAPASADAGLIDINTASAQELDEIKGVGPATAEKIIALRAERGGFSSVDELLDVPGIGAKTLEKMRSQITVGGRRTG